MPSLPPLPPLEAALRLASPLKIKKSLNGTKEVHLIKTGPKGEREQRPLMIVCAGLTYLSDGKKELDLLIESWRNMTPDNFLQCKRRLEV